MTYYLYVDVFFLVNFFMDFLLLNILRRILKAPATTFRVLLGSGIGAVWAVMAAAISGLPPMLEAFLTYVVISALMVKTAFGIRGWVRLFKAVAGLYAAAVMMGGAFYGLYYHTRAGYYLELLLQGRFALAVPLAIWILLAGGAYFGIKFLWLTLMDASGRRKHLYQVTLYYKGRKECITALLDTGNHLYEPVTHKPVHVIAYSAIDRLCSSVNGVIYIPFRSVGKEDGLLPGLFLDAMVIEEEGGPVKVLRPLVAIVKQPLSSHGEYQMLLHDLS